MGYIEEEIPSLETITFRFHVISSGVMVTVKMEL